MICLNPANVYDLKANWLLNALILYKLTSMCTILMTVVLKYCYLNIRVWGSRLHPLYITVFIMVASLIYANVILNLTWYYCRTEVSYIRQRQCSLSLVIIDHVLVGQTPITVIIQQYSDTVTPNSPPQTIKTTPTHPKTIKNHSKTPPN